MAYIKFERQKLILIILNIFSQLEDKKAARNPAGSILNSSTAYILACNEIADRITMKPKMTTAEISKTLREISSSYHLTSIPKNESIIRFLPFDSEYRKTLMVRPIKTASGVAVVAVMPKPYECPHGRCIYCPGGIEHNTPLSYTGSEPSTRIAQKSNYDSFKQVVYKLHQLESRGHSISKIEVVIVGGTFPFLPDEYQLEFVKGCFDALNTFGEKRDLSSTLEQAKKFNETSESRCVGLTVETKPDYCKRKQVELLLELGVTRVEIGVQSLRDNVYRTVNRGHTLKDVIESFQIARDAGCKIVAHMMPGLPNTTLENDITDFKTLFYHPSFKPDMIKIYPTLVLEGTGLFNLYKSGRYNAYTDEDMIKILIEVKKIVPPWVRIMRVQREIESSDIRSGPKCGNLRQLALEELKKIGLKCKCIRCREVGLQNGNSYLSGDMVVLNRIDYDASDGHEVFLSYENQDRSVILGFLRLRHTNNPLIKMLKTKDESGVALVRELHVYGQAVDVGQKTGSDKYQHKGFGFCMLNEAESIVKNEFGINNLSVISAVGTREYYRKFGYHQNGPYMTKRLS
ncbi:MAG: tRNA uridine(34) 5-carboxymethylaminomethyl modification radical SAM/GNAT enzyme Elp3 [Nitrososphaeraceae archaeon]